MSVRSAATLEQWLEMTQSVNWRDLATWSHLDLCRFGIDRLNLLACAGLPGTEKMDIPFCVRTLDAWAQRVKEFTAKERRNFDRHPQRFGNSLGYFKALILATVLQKEFGVRYNPAKIDPTTTLDVADSFIFGVIQGDGGNCASLPVVYCAVGHRLRYPMFLRTAKGDGVNHSYVCWDDGQERFNIETTATGLSTPTDDRYRTGMFKLTPDIERAGCFIQNHDMRESFAVFLKERANFCADFGAYNGAVHSMAWAASLQPQNEAYLNSTVKYYNEWLEIVNGRKPPGFPPVQVRIDVRRFPPAIPADLEFSISGLEIAAHLLGDPHLEYRFWAPLRRREVPSGLPAEFEGHFKADGSKTIRFRRQSSS